MKKGPHGGTLAIEDASAIGSLLIEAVAEASLGTEAALATFSLSVRTAIAADAAGNEDDEGAENGEDGS